MELLQLALVLVSAVLVSSVLEIFLPRVSLPLVQMAIGAIMYFFVPLPTQLGISSDFFLVMFIAPLLFDESRNVNNQDLWQNKRSILSLAVGLVLVLLLALGFTLHLLVPSVPLAAAFALGAALGPTDAVAVASLGKEIKLNARQKALLSGEALLNDASGVVSFQFAIAAAVTGAFSMSAAGRTFAVEFFGGILAGIVIGAAAVFVIGRVRRFGMESVTFHVCFELLLPFLVYLLAQQVHVSGILAVVSAGLFMAYVPQAKAARTARLSSFVTRLSIASESVWSLISFVLNGIVFTFLGFVLPSTVAPALKENSTDIIWLVSLVIVLTVVAVAVRLTWVVAADLLSQYFGQAPKSEHLLRDALVTTLAGAKGAVSLSIALTIPVTLASGASFPQRDLLLFLICGVIVTTLLIANFVVPLIAPHGEKSESFEIDVDVQVEMLQNVVEGLRDQKCPGNKRATERVIHVYQERIAKGLKKNASQRQLRYLRQEVLRQQRDFIKDAMAADRVDQRLAERYLARIERMLKHLMRGHSKSSGEYAQVKPLASSTAFMSRVQRKIHDSKGGKRGRLSFKIELEQVALTYLEQVAREVDEERREAAEALISEHTPLYNALKSQLRTLDRTEIHAGSVPDSPQDSYIARSDSGSLSRVSGAEGAGEPAGLEEVQAEGLRLELDEIQQMHELGRLTGAEARELREEIYLLQMGLAD